MDRQNMEISGTMGQSTSDGAGVTGNRRQAPSYHLKELRDLRRPPVEIEGVGPAKLRLRLDLVRHGVLLEVIDEQCELESEPRALARALPELVYALYHEANPRLRPASLEALSTLELSWLLTQALRHNAVRASDLEAPERSPFGQGGAPLTDGC